MSTLRRALSRVSSDIKQGQYISAATAIRESARLFTKGVSMIKNEQDEFETLLYSGCELLRYHKEVTKYFPLSIEYTPGQEGALVGLMNQLIETLQEASTEEALKQHRERKQAGLDKGRKELADGEHDEARRTFRELTGEYSDDGHLAAEVGESFMQVGLYQDAAEHLTVAAQLSPDSAHVFNRLGISLRKMKRYDTAEGYFLQALELEKNDPNLYFNLGRLYFDWMHWEKTVFFAEKALQLNAQFTEAAKLAAYAKRKLAEAQ
ncbi:MAG: tetratricopeptide repeat protein [Desulfovibrio sp.]|nr:tetratricopeptide repeat protein [Desulfovibrio sp.]